MHILDTTCIYADMPTRILAESVQAPRGIHFVPTAVIIVEINETEHRCTVIPQLLHVTHERTKVKVLTLWSKLTSNHDTTIRSVTIVGSPRLAISSIALGDVNSEDHLYVRVIS